MSTCNYKQTFSTMQEVCSWMEVNGKSAYTPNKKGDADADVFWATDFPDTDKPCLTGTATIRVVLVGAQGTGKTTLFNKLTGARAKTSGGTETCTRKNELKACLPPFENVELIDTPGTATDDVHYDDSFQLREALIRKPVNLITLVCGLPAVNRLSEVITSLKPMDKIMRSSTFTLDAQGVVAPAKSPLKTRVLLTLTHRDRFSLPKEEFQKYVEGIREAYDWVGSVIMVDLNVPTHNLLGAIILPATCMSARDYSIPMTEFCSRFPISRVLDQTEEMRIMAKVMEFNNGMTIALAKMNEKLQARQASGFSGSAGHVDAIGPSMDCILRFLDDLYDRKTLEAVSLLEGVPVEDLWVGTDEDINVKRVEKWNAVKAKMGEGYERNKNLVAMNFPVRPIDAIYRKCNHCGIVYVKPTGCDFGTTCGQTQSGADSLPYTYEYVEAVMSFDILEGKRMGMFEASAYRMRKAFSDMVTRQRTLFYGAQDSGAVVLEHNLDKPCGKPIRWETMIPLTLEELQRHKLVPEGMNYAATITETAVSRKDMSLKVKLKGIADQLGLDTSMNPTDMVKAARESLGVERLPSTGIKVQVDYLYGLCFPESEDETERKSSSLVDPANIDIAFAGTLAACLEETAIPTLVGDCVQPLHVIGVDVQDVMRKVGNKRAKWTAEYLGSKGLAADMIESILVIFVNTLPDPPVFNHVASVLRNPTRLGSDSRPSHSMKLCMPYTKLLDHSICQLPRSFDYEGIAYRGMKHVYLDLETKFSVGKVTCWYEFKSVTYDEEVLKTDDFCGLSGARTIYVISNFKGKKIEEFSALPHERELLAPSLSLFEVERPAKKGTMAFGDPFDQADIIYLKMLPPCSPSDWEQRLSHLAPGSCLTSL